MHYSITYGKEDKTREEGPKKGREEGLQDYDDIIRGDEYDDNEKKCKNLEERIAESFVIVTTHV